MTKIIDNDILDAIKDEIIFLKECEQYYGEQGSILLESRQHDMAQMLERLVRRIEDGHEFTLAVNSKNDTYIKTTKKSDVSYRDNPAMQDAVDHYNTVKTMVSK